MAHSNNILVTGGAGFIGAHLVRHLLANGANVVALDDLSGGYRENVPEEATFVQGSILDAELVNQLFEQSQFQYVYHLAAYAAEGLSPYIRNFNYQNNLVGSANLINASVNYKVECFVFTSSIAVYGHSEPPMLESDVPQPADPYGIAKYAVELDLKAAHDQFGLNYVIFRPHNVFGEFQNLADPHRNVAGIFMRQLLNQQPMTVFGDGNQTRAFTYVGDILPAITKAPSVQAALNQTFNIGGDEVYSVNHLAEAISDALGKPRNIEYLPQRFEATHAHADHALAKQILDFLPQTDLTTGLQKMAQWAQAQPLQPPRPFTNLEIRPQDGN